MSEVVNGKELKGLGGWLVLFQIQIWNTLAGTAQMMVLFPLLGMFFKRMFLTEPFYSYGLQNIDILKIYTSPVVFAFAAVIFVLTLLCVIFFYKKKLIFRIFFIIESVIYFAGMILFYFYMIKNMANIFADSLGSAGPFTGVFTVVFIAFGLLPMLGIMIAFIIALYKSKRVKNTFS